MEEQSEARRQLVLKLYALFRERGYDGVSIADIAKATGLGRSSLYHHFPGGKEEMATAVVAFAGDWLAAHVFAPLRAREPVGARIDEMLRALDALYEGGGAPCVLASMLVGPPQGPLGEGVKSLLSDWLAALQAALIEAGLSAEDAARLSATAIGRIEGALFLSRALGRRQTFADELRAVRAMLPL